ncbi:MAG: cytochrome c oxidase subunit 3 [Iamia sp.]
MPGVDTTAGPPATGEGSVGPTARTATDRDVPGRPSILGVGVVVWLASELMFFAGLFGSHFFLGSTTDIWPPPGVELDTLRAFLATLVLVASSGTIHLAVVAGERADRRRLIRWLLVTAGLGSLFLANLLLEYAGLDFSISSHAYGSTFYLMTGFHGLHVFGGILFMFGVIALLAGRSKAPAAPPVAVVGYYWHFVDVVWVIMFLTLYVLGA